MPLELYNNSAEDAADAVVDLIDAGAAAGRLEIRSGAQPAVNAALTGTVLSTITLSDPAFGAASASGSGGVATASGLPITDASADATGTAGYGAVLDSDNNVIFTGGVATDTSEVFQLSTLSIVSGQPVTLNTFTYTQPQT